MDEDQDELLPTTDESLSENEDHYLPVDKVIDSCKHNLIYQEHSKPKFVIIKLLLIFSTLVMIILLPLYIDTVNVSGNVYSLFLTNTLFSSLLFVMFAVVLKLIFSRYKCIKIFKLPIQLKTLIWMSFIYFISAVMILYALDRKRVVCHLQDPLKSLILVWSFLYYFLFCQRFMHLQQIFSVTIVIIGTFISLDYNLCDKFKCRGFERQHISDDTGDWSWQSHLMWTFVYISGLALFAAYLTSLEQFFIGAIKAFHNTVTPLEETVSQSHSVSTTSASTSTEPEMEDPCLYKRINTIHLAMWLHIVGLIIAIMFFGIDFIPQIGKGSSATEVLNYTVSGIHCHFSKEARCKNLPLISWLFLCAYVAFVTVSIQFLILTHSAVYTVATMTTALPLAGLWWSLFPMIPIERGLLVWEPALTGELISSVLGLPIIIMGLYFLYESHFKSYYRSKLFVTQLQVTMDTT